MKTYIARRLLALLPVALVVATVAFVLMHLAPGDPASVIAGPDASADDVQKLSRQLGLDAPLPVQLVRWYGRLVRGDLGQSIFLRKPVTEAILDRVEPTLLLTLFATFISVAIGVPAGPEAASGARHRRTVLRAARPGPLAPAADGPEADLDELLPGRRPRLQMA